MPNMSSNIFLSDLSKALRNGFHSFFYIPSVFETMELFYSSATITAIIIPILNNDGKDKIERYHKYPTIALSVFNDYLLG